MTARRLTVRRAAVALAVALALVAVRSAADSGDDDDEDTTAEPGDAAPATSAPSPSASAGGELALLPPERRAQVDAELRRVLASKSYAFCHDPAADLSYSDLDLCPLAESAHERCPAFADACKRALSRADGCAQRSEKARPRSDLFSVGWLAELIATLARGMLWIVTIGVVVFIALELSRAFGRRAPSQSGEPSAVPLPDEAENGAPVETDVARLLARARACALRGDFRSAVDDLYRALLRHLDANALIALHPSHTNGDYARQLAPAPDLARTFRELARELERVQFGRRVPTAELFEWLETRIVPIVTRVVGVLLLLGVALGTNGCRHRDTVGGDLRAQWCGTDPSGYGAFCALMSDSEVSVRQRVRPLDAVEDDVNVVVVVTERLPDEQWGVLKSWTEHGGTLILAARRTPLDEWAKLTRSSGRRCGGALELSTELARGALAHADFAAPENHTFSGVADDNAIARCRGDGYVVQSWPGDGAVIAIPSPELLTNASLAAKDNALLVTALIHPGTGVVEIVGPWTGSGADNPFRAISHAGLGPWMLQVLALMAVFAWSRGRRFGTARELVAGTRHAFVEHVRALGERYRARAASRFVLGHYAAWALERLRDRLRAQGRARLSDLAEAAAHRTGQDTASVMRLLVEARSAQDDPAGDAGEHLRTLRGLAELLEKLESSGEHRRISSTLR